MYGNIRVRKALYVSWAEKSGLRVAPAVRLMLVPSPPDDELIETHLGYTINGAVKELASSYPVNNGEMRDRIWDAVVAGKLKLIDPQTGIPFERLPAVERDWFNRIRTADLNPGSNP